MKPWIKPAVGWGHVYPSGELASEIKASKMVQGATWGRKNIIHVAIIPYAAARKAGLLRRPK